MVLSHLAVAKAAAQRVPPFWKEDASQEAVIGLMRAASEFDPKRGAKFSTFAFTVVRNQVRAAAPQYSPSPIQTERKADSPQDRLENKELVRAAMDRLMPRVRAMVELRYGEREHTFSEIGAALGCSEATVRATVAAALVKLKDLIEDAL